MSDPDPADADTETETDDSGRSETDRDTAATFGAEADEPTSVEQQATEEAAGGGDGDTFGVGIHVTERELQFTVRVPSSIDSGWSDPEEFQRLVERVVWACLDQESTLRAVASSAETGETVTLGTVTLRPDGTVVDHALSLPSTVSIPAAAETEPKEESTRAGEGGTRTGETNPDGA